MSADLSSLLILANSGRAMAQSAARGGFSVSVLDGFCDQDTQAVASCRQVRFGADGLLDPQQLSAEIDSLVPGCPGAVVYGAGLEGNPSLLRRLSARCRLLGNDPSVLELLCNPSAFFSLLDRLQIPYPEVRLLAPEPTSGTRWLVKKAGSSGGQGVNFRNHERPASDPGYYYQRYLPGSVMSALFIADGELYRTIGLNRLRATPLAGLSPFIYAGALGQASLPETLRRQVESSVGKLVCQLGLRGVNSLDFVLSNGEIFVLDLNTRPSATLELYEHQLNTGWMNLHIQACLGSMPEVLPPDPVPAVQGHLIVYAPQVTEIPAAMTWPEWARDRPAAGTRIAGGEPVCSLFAQGREADAVEARLQQYQSVILTRILSPAHKSSQGRK